MCDLFPIDFLLTICLTSSLSLSPLPTQLLNQLSSLLTLIAHVRCNYQSHTSIFIRTTKRQFYPLHSPDNSRIWISHKTPKNPNTISGHSTAKLSLLEPGSMLLSLLWHFDLRCEIYYAHNFMCVLSICMSEVASRMRGEGKCRGRSMDRQRRAAKMNVCSEA